MNAHNLNQGAGEKLKALRLDSRLTTREVEKVSLQISESKGNPEYYISHAWVTEIENGKFTPSIYKFYTLSVIYHSRLTDMLDFFGISLSDLALDQMAVRLPKTHLISGSLSPSQEALAPLLQSGAASESDQTRMLSPLPEGWGKLPLSALQDRSPKNKLYGYVGLQDFTLYPIVRPGAIVEIDSRQRRVDTAYWTTEHDRPIYFVELPKGYVCSWCQLNDHQLNIIPHPISGRQIQIFRYPGEAEIVGRVTAVAMRIVELEHELPAGTSRNEPCPLPPT
jgi:transcriptional regulator with XRE-family HTH domain